MKLTKFKDWLPIPPVLKPLTRSGGYTYYEVKMKGARQSLHSELPETPIWGYEGMYPGPTLEVQSGEKVYVKWMNDLPQKHLFPIDHTVHGAGREKPIVRTVVHLHGGRTEPESDGYPDAWFTNAFLNRGPFFKKKVYEYSNHESARALWYHDHAIGISRLNIYAGLAGFYLIRDQHEHSLNLPAGPFEIPLMIQDRSFHEDGSLKYPDHPRDNHTGIFPSIIPSFFGEAILVNGRVWPYLEVEPRKYRFRLLNAANARFFQIKMDSGQRFYQIGTDSGFLERPVRVKSILLAPSERADVIIDFTNLDGKSITLQNTAPAVFPAGDRPDSDTTGTIMQFRVAKPLSGPDTSMIPAHMDAIHWLSEPSASYHRFLELSEEKDQYGRPLFLLDEKKWDDPVSERPRNGSIEVWNFINSNNDDHPIHIHLVQFQILSRQPFDLDHYKKTGKIKYSGPRFAPESGEQGWKDTVRCPPAQITKIIIPFFPYRGRYVWHCHMLEHEDYEMMRPYDIH